MYIPSLANKSPVVHAVFLTVTLIPLYFGSYQFRLRYPYATPEPVPSTPQTPEDFVHFWLDIHLVQPFNPSAISSYCNLSSWHPNLVFNLANANGGIGNVRGNILDFLFYAIEAGASIILPSMASRSQEDISNVWADRVPFDSMFDEDWFIYAMEQACPQMSVYKPLKGQRMADSLPGNYYPRSRRVDLGQENTQKAYVEHLDAWLKSNEGYAPENLTLVNLERTLWDVDTRSLPPGLRRNFAQLLRVNPKVRRLAGIVVQRLAEKFSFLEIDPRDTIPKNAFYGAHLRTEADAQAAGWMNGLHANFSAQTDAHIEQATKHKLDVIYVASGDVADLQRFRAKAASHAPPLIVTSKLDLLPPTELDVLKELTWDQQALVDYQVLQRSSVFGGLVKSSFSYNIAITRNQWSEDQGRVSDPWYVMHEEVGVAFDDGLSRILSRDGWHEQRIPRGMWP